VTLRQRIEQEIRERGPIPFSRYMELCLYEPHLGYYARHAGQFGKAGDFYTASDVHAVFGRLLARQFEEMWRTLGSPARIEILELGSGRGLFAQDVLDWSGKKFPDFFRALHFKLMESSAALWDRLQETLKMHLQSGKASLISSSTPSAAKAINERAPIGTTEAVPSPVGNPTIVFANEFFDALPVEVVGSEGELRIDLHSGQFVEAWVPASDEELEFLDRYSVHPEEGERVEVSLLGQRYMSAVAESVGSRFVIVIDYGYTRNEQLAGRHRGPVMTYRQHSASRNPYEAPGQQDITAHVNFTALAATAEQHGMHTHQLLTQSQFLMGIGEENQFADAFEECRLPQERAKVALQLKHLVTPAGMGETFHVLLASKGVDPVSAASLSGLNFGRTRL
jgi:SAM-dependent MidA family methyltransferase